VHSFAYILSLHPAGTPFQQCNLHSVEFMYGRPSSIVIVAGTQQHPLELLLFYDNGASIRGRL